jgi:hypothetical protein
VAGPLGGPAGLQIGGQFQGNVNLGAGGSLQGFTGGQLGQLGNLGGQFGLQGGTQEQLLITLIRQVVGRPKDWALRYNPITGQPLDPLEDEKTDGGSLNQENNNLGYYPPSLALVVKAPSTIHTRPSSLVIQGAAAPAAGMAAAPRPPAGGGVLVDGRPAPVRIDVGDDGGAKKGPRILEQDKDPKRIWQDALVKGRQEPGMIIATADYLALNGKFDHAAEFLKANLREGIVVKAWVFQSLAVALRESGGSAEEIERAEVSVAALEPLNARGYLVAARGLAEDKNYERALAFCKQAADLMPGVPHAYSDAVRYADMAQDASAMTWAASGLLSQEWPARNDDLQRTARERVEGLAKRLAGPAADRLRQSVKTNERRDLVIRLLWQGEADLDLRVLEPSGSVASALQRQTVGGGALVGNSLVSPDSETYVAAEAFDGEYVITVERVWGRPLGNRAQLRIIRYQGTPRETEELVTIRMTSDLAGPVRVTLTGGRRTEMAYVPPVEAHQDDGGGQSVESQDAVLARLRVLSDPEVTGAERGMRGAAVSAGRSPERPISLDPRRNDNDRTLYQNRVQSFVRDSLDVTAQAVLSADRQSVRLSVSPVFTAGAGNRPVTIVSPVVPGGR